MSPGKQHRSNRRLLPMAAARKCHPGNHDQRYPGKANKKKISLFWVKGLKILGSVGRSTSFIDRNTFQNMHKILYCSEKKIQKCQIIYWCLLKVFYLSRSVLLTILHVTYLIFMNYTI